MRSVSTMGSVGAAKDGVISRNKGRMVVRVLKVDMVLFFFLATRRLG
jgi:hypothetical protein